MTASSPPSPPVDPAAPPAKLSRADEVHARLRDDIFEFRMPPGERFTETQIAERLAVSRTPVREALMRLQTEGLVRGYFRSGWEVVPIDFNRFDQLYELRALLEGHAAEVIAGAAPPEREAARAAMLDRLADIWCRPPEARERETSVLARLDESFHSGLIEAAGNAEIARVHAEVTDRIRIIRRLDFGYAQRIAATYDEHAAIVRALQRHRGDQAALLIRAHIRQSQAEVRKITLHRLHSFGAR
ncbi:GntR family transcriptional regulator [Derxia gummosa]|uniref:GntR family transcriptional regulator n=1 Tax=Derxia gummosa DSM 723 TaxID=1121388 RepID=A0A8B6X4Y3_9BURK|nr:GntR family transcriptional regulator [Derxia gummosa]